jgi:capsular polysaccharide transport system permease protein
MTFMLDAPPALKAVVTRLAPPESTPLLIGSEEEGWSPGRLALLATLFLLPSMLALAYYSFVAADVYVSDSQFVVRSQGQMSASGLVEGLGQGTGVAVGAADVNAVISYIGSRDALEAVSRRINLRQAYGAPAGDIVARFPGLFGGRTAEDLFHYYTRQVEVEHDKGTGVTTLTVSAFDATTAQAIARLLLEEAEQIVNAMSERMRRDTMTQAERHVAESGRQIASAQQALQEWRAREKQFDPGLYSKSVVEVVTRLSIAIAEARASRAALLQTSPRNPEIAVLDNKIETLTRQVRAEWLSLAGASESLAPLISEYERLIIDRDLAVKLYAAANESLERTRSDVRRQSVFVERISEPPAADKPLYPKRVLSILTAMGFAFLVFLVVDYIRANISRHRRLDAHVRHKAPEHG